MLFNIYKRNYPKNILLGKLEADYIWNVDVRGLLAYYTDDKKAIFTEPYFYEGKMDFGCLTVEKVK